MKNILVVEDDELMREFVALILRNAGYDVETADDGVEAGMAVLSKPPALIVADVLMPGLDGFEFVATLRQLRKTRDIPVIFLTSHAAGETRGKELGAIAYLHKPLNAEKLLSVVASALRQDSQRALSRS
jgi:two-component system, OmpR family, alkaline phosphatase synthesis response regulator PhoP